MNYNTPSFVLVGMARLNEKNTNPDGTSVSLKKCKSAGKDDVF